jgi:hypothetical protein
VRAGGVRELVVVRHDERAANAAFVAPRPRPKALLGAGIIVGAFLTGRGFWGVDLSRLPESMRRRAEELERQPPLEKVRDFLGNHVNDMESVDEVRADLRLVAASGTWGLKLDMRALDAVLAESQPPGVLSEMVAWDANWVLDDPSDQGAAEYLRQIAEMLREVLEEVEQRR